MDNEMMAATLEDLAKGYDGAFGESPASGPTTRQLEEASKQVCEIADSMRYLALCADAAKRGESDSRHLMGLVGDVARTASQRCLIAQALLDGEDPSACLFG